MILGTHKAFIAAFQRDDKWLVSGQNGSQIRLTRAFNGTAVTVLLERTLSGYYTIEPVTYAFKSTISHFDYTTDEDRRIRNKNVIKSLIRTLIKVKIWDGIENKESFIQINNKNKKSDKKKLTKEFNSFLK